jgi:hypothetical protein
MVELGRCSIIIGNFRSKTGMALLTKAQREWIDLKKLFDRQRPSKRPLNHPTSPIRKWCYDRAVHKHGWWARTMTLFFILHILILMYVFIPFLHLIDVTHALFEKDSNLSYKQSG